MQETAQLAAWISQHPPSDDELAAARAKDRKFTRILIAQDRDQIFIVTGSLSADYVDYIRTPSTAPASTADKAALQGTIAARLKRTNLDEDGFLKMAELGPLNVHNGKHMSIFGIILLRLLKTLDRVGGELGVSESH